MSRKRLQLTGMRFHRLQVLEPAGKKGESSLWRCLCDCGNERLVVGHRLTSDQIRSCGCTVREANSKDKFRHGHSACHHLNNGKATPTYSSWRAMVRRCRCSTTDHYDVYGGSGIDICEEWAKFENFLNDMGERPEGTSIDRIDNSKGYFKENCRWATSSQQAYNTGMRKTNTSGHKNVTWQKSHNKWRVAIRKQGKNYFFGYFSDLKEASEVAMMARDKLFGEFANHG